MRRLCCQRLLQRRFAAQFLGKSLPTMHLAPLRAHHLRSKDLLDKTGFLSANAVTLLHGSAFVLWHYSLGLPWRSTSRRDQRCSCNSPSWGFHFEPVSHIYHGYAVRFTIEGTAHVRRAHMEALNRHVKPNSMTCIARIRWMIPGAKHGLGAIDFGVRHVPTGTGSLLTHLSKGNCNAQKRWKCSTHYCLFTGGLLFNSVIKHKTMKTHKSNTTWY